MGDGLLLSFYYFILAMQVDLLVLNTYTLYYSDVKQLYILTNNQK